MSNITFEKACNLEGFLKKKSPVKFTGYQKRYFMIRDSGKMLAYFGRKPKAGDEPKGVLLLNLILNVEVKNETKFVLHYSERKFILRADNPDSQALWVSSLRVLIEKSKEVPEEIHASANWKDKRLADEVAQSVKIEIEAPSPAPRLSDSSDLNTQIMSTKGIWKYLSTYPDRLLKRHMQCGFLNKRSKGAVKYFQKRWFILVSGNPIIQSADEESLTEDNFPPWMHLNNIYYFKWAGNDDDTEALGEIPTRLVTIRVKDMSNSRDSGSSFLLDLGNRIFHLNADNEEDLNKWIKAIEASKENAQEVTASITGKPKYVKKLIQLFDTNGKNALNKKISDKFKEKTKNLTTYPENLKETLEELIKLTEDMVETIDGCISHIPQRLDIAEIYAQTFHKMLCEFLSKLWKDSHSELTSESLLQLIIWTGQYDTKLRSVGINDQRVYSGISLLSAEFSMKFFEDTCLAIYESIKKAAFGQVETEVNTGRYVVCYKELCSYIEPVFIEIQNCSLPQFAEKALEVIREVVYTYINAVTEICERNLVVPMICVAGFCNDTVMIIEKFKSWQIKAKSTLDASLINLHLRTRETTSSIVSLEKMVKDFFALSLIDRINDSFELPFNELHMEILFPQIAKELNGLENFAERNLINYVWRCLMEVVIQKYVNCIFSNKKAMKTQSVLLLSETLRSDGDMFKKYFCAKFDKSVVEKQLQSLYDIVDFLEALPSDIVSACEKVKKIQGQDFDFLTAVKNI